MEWFMAKIVYRIITGAGNHMAQFEEQLRLIQATHISKALQKATEIGRKGEDFFYNQQLQLVQWQFLNVTELKPLQHLNDGIELYTRIEEHDNAEAYMLTLQRRHSQLTDTINLPL
jgi:hypothetical protein